MLKTKIIGGVVILLGMIAGFVFLMRGCMSRYDERAALTPALYFEKAGKAVVFAIVKYGKATSYKSNGGSTFKSLNTYYYIQSNNAETGEVIGVKEIKHSSDIKFHPVTTMGSGNGRAWVFMGELLAYDPFTLEKVADREIIEARNPQLKGKMPDQENYYNYNTATNEVMITATDGIKYALSTTTLQATAVEEDAVTENPLAVKLKALKTQETMLNQKYTANYDRFRTFNKLYSEKKISYAAYQDSSKHFNLVQDTIRDMKKALQTQMEDLGDMVNSDRDMQRMIDNMRNGSKSYTATCTAVDTFNGKWYGLLSNSDLEKPDTRFRYRSVYTETARNRFYEAETSIKDPSKKAIELVIAEPQKINDAVYLQGGFLLNKATALPVHLTNQPGFIICSKEKVGYEGSIILTRVNLAGKALWSYNTKLKLFGDWIYTGNRLIILGNDNKEISSTDANLLLIIDLQNGKAVMHDYFTDKMRKEN